MRNAALRYLVLRFAQALLSTDLEHLLHLPLPCALPPAALALLSTDSEHMFSPAAVRCCAARRYEIGVASTKAYTSQILCITMMALSLAEDSISKRTRRDQIIDELGQLPGKVKQVGGEEAKVTAADWIVLRVKRCLETGAAAGQGQAGEKIRQRERNPRNSLVFNSSAR